MDFLIGLVVLGILAYIIIKVYFFTFDAAANLAKEIIKTAILESRKDNGNWDDIK